MSLGEQFKEHDSIQLIASIAIRKNLKYAHTFAQANTQHTHIYVCLVVQIILQNRVLKLSTLLNNKIYLSFMGVKITRSFDILYQQDSTTKPEDYHVNSVVEMRIS